MSAIHLKYIYRRRQKKKDLLRTCAKPKCAIYVLKQAHVRKWGLLVARLCLAWTQSCSASKGGWAGFIFRLYRKGVSLNFVSKGMWSGSGCREGNWILSTLSVEKTYSSFISLLFIYIVVRIKLLTHNLSKVITVYKQKNIILHWSIP